MLEGKPPVPGGEPPQALVSRLASGSVLAQAVRKAARPARRVVKPEIRN
jgi:hypothetical protein